MFMRRDSSDVVSASCNSFWISSHAEGSSIWVPDTIGAASRCDEENHRTSYGFCRARDKTVSQRIDICFLRRAAGARVCDV